MRSLLPGDHKDEVPFTVVLFESDDAPGCRVPGVLVEAEGVEPRCGMRLRFRPVLVGDHIIAGFGQPENSCYCMFAGPSKSGRGASVLSCPEGFQHHVICIVAVAHGMSGGPLCIRRGCWGRWRSIIRDSVGAG